METKVVSLEYHPIHGLCMKLSCLLIGVLVSVQTYDYIVATTKEFDKSPTLHKASLLLVSTGISPARCAAEKIRSKSYNSCEI